MLAIAGWLEKRLCRGSTVEADGREIQRKTESVMNFETTGSRYDIKLFVWLASVEENQRKPCLWFRNQ